MLGVFLLTLVGLAALTRVRGPVWVALPLVTCLLGCLFYRTFKRHLFLGVEVVLVFGYFVLIKIFHSSMPAVYPASQAIEGLHVVGLVILYPAQMALWTSRRTVQELALLGLVAISQFLYGMTLARPVSWILALLFFLALLYTLLQYATAREIESARARPPRPRGYWLRLGGLTLVLLPGMLGLGAAVFYLVPRLSTLTQVLDVLGKSEAGNAPGPAARRSEGRGEDLESGPSQEMDLLTGGTIKRDSTPVFQVRIRLESLGAELTPGYAERLYLRSVVLDDYVKTEVDGSVEHKWKSSASYLPMKHAPGPDGIVELPGAPSREKCGFGAHVKVLSRMGGEFLVSPGRPVRVVKNRPIRGHPEAWLQFARRLRRREAYAVEGEMIYAWEQVSGAVKRAGLEAEHPEMEHFTRIPDRLRSDEVKARARRLTAEAVDDADRLTALVRHLRSRFFSYTLDVPPVGDRSNPTADFLLSSRTGHCERFADGLAALCRHAEIPCRVINGYMGGQWRETPAPGGFRFQARDAHAWVEVHFAGLGWIMVDPSPQGGVANLGLAPPLATLLDPASLRKAPVLGPVSFTAEEQLSLYQHLLEVFRTLQDTGILKFVLAALAVLVLGFVVRRRIFRGSKPGAGAEKIPEDPRFNPILEFYRALGHRGIRPGRGETPLELARRAAGALELDLVPVMERIYAARFGGFEFTSEERRALDTWIAGLRRPDRSRSETGSTAGTPPGGDTSD